MNTLTKVLIAVITVLLFLLGVSLINSNTHSGNLGHSTILVPVIDPYVNTQTGQPTGQYYHVPTADWIEQF
jgi:hypothetical protein